MTAVLDTPAQATAPDAARKAIVRVFLGRRDDPAWARPALWAVLLLAGALYTWNLTASGDANTYYAAAVYSGAQSWKAWFFGALDAGAFITVDKPPFALWVMGLSARVFGYSSWSMLLPQALAGVAAVGVLYSSVRRGLIGRLGPAGAAGGATVAALVLALTPITVAINRDNNPDTLLVLLLVAAAWCCQRAAATGRLLPLLACAALLGCAFNTKMLQAFVPLPAFALGYLLLADAPLGRRMRNLLLAGVALVVSSGWWMGVVALVPASARPYIGGSTDNTVWDLVIGYNGLGRVFGGSGGGPGGGGGASFGGEPGALRLFNTTMAGQISWLLPAAALLAVAGLAVVGRAPRPDPARALLALWTGWLLLHHAVFSFAEGTFHPYYTTAMAPAVAALVGAGAALLWRARGPLALVLPLTAAVTGAWAFTVLRRTPDWHPWIAWTTAALTAAAVLLLLSRALRPAAHTLTALALTALLACGLTGPAAYALAAASTPVNGTNPTAGPSTGPSGRPNAAGFPGAPPQNDGTAPTAPDQRDSNTPGGSDAPGGSSAPSGSDAPGGPSTSGGSDMPGGSGAPGGSNASGGSAAPGGSGPGGFGGRGGPGGRSGLDEETVAFLVANQGSALWLVAVSDAQSAASLILKTGEPVISMGGFTGSDEAMSVARLKELVASGRLKYLVVGGRGFGGPGGGVGGTDEVTAWVREHGTVVEGVGDGSLYALTTEATVS
ncbi:glycosyltransferase family 39 protein [Actinocorallia sp. API 0066]|uniref:ArnT family glycosyltransferase n=1 Tax=Actinocorallia sp. API 0066 TaxID=2896846 RepID=UPI001E43673C|nr:glycosyltransferase family 39 protein [Actinocorallia sp. API 0066]MCD0450746.1 glycosyltransferase family 39 protein [Actinocorallia sp. API 0066]